jgi:hypothetical protein
LEPLVQAIAALEASPFGAWARGSSYAYPLANLIHLAGLILLVGGIGLLDLRLAGAFRSLPVRPLEAVLTPLAIAGLALMAPSGFVMFAADARALSGSDAFRLKLILIGLALANAVAYRLAWRRQIAERGGEPPGPARAMAVVSLLLWLAVATLGRLIAYS